MRQNYLFKRIGIYSILQILVCFSLYAQQGFSAYDIATKSNSYYPVSVSASQLFSKPPEQMDYSQGRATIRIPIYEIHTGGLTLPISLYYTTGGIRADQKNGSIGIGWQLEAEPMIARTIRGQPDELLYLSDGKQMEENSTFFRLRVATGKADIQQDIFNYRLLSGSGKFLLHPSSDMSFAPVILSKEDVRIETDGKIRTDFSNPIFITDTSGNRYTFGESDQSLEITSQGGAAERVTTWKASAITSPDGEKITFSYLSNVPVEYHSLRYDFYTVEDQFSSNISNPPSDLPPHPGYWKGINGKMNYYYLSGYKQNPNGSSVPIMTRWPNVSDKHYDQPSSSVRSRLVSQIHFRGGSVVFHYDSSSKLLKEIQVYFGSKLQKRITLITKQTIDSSRYFLNKVCFFDSDGHGTGNYEFDYYPAVYYPNGSYAIDYWGYYKAGPGSDMVPMQTIPLVDNPNNPSIDISIGSTDGEGDFQNSLAFSLRQVTYPSGGRTEYTYESNQAYRADLTSASAGGVRLASVTDKPIVGKDVVRTFKYGNNRTLNGIGYSAFPICPQTFAQKTEKHYLLQGNLGQLFSHSGRCRTYSNQNFVTSDCNIYYPCVSEETDGVRTMYHYPNNFSTVCGEESRYPAPIGYDQVLSCEDSCVYYRNSFSIESRRVFPRPYSIGFVNDIKPLATFDNIIDPSNIKGNLKELFLNSYSVRSTSVYHKDAGMIEIISKRSDGNTSSKEIQRWNYDAEPHKQLRSIETENEKVEFDYPGDSPSKAAHSLMLRRNETATPVETRHYVDGALRKLIRYDYEVDTCTTRGYSLSSMSEGTNADGNTLRVAERYEEYLPCGKPCQVTRQDGRIICLIWANEGEWLIAAIEGMTAGQVRSAGIDLQGISRQTGVSDSTYAMLDGLRNSHPEACIITYRYQPTGELISKKSSNGVAEYYSYDGAGRLSAIKDNQLKTISNYEYHEANQ